MNNIWWKKKYYVNFKNKNHYFPNNIDINLIVCTKECSHAYLGTAKFKHICDHCKTEMKTQYHLKYKLAQKRLFKIKDRYQNYPIVYGNNDQSKNWIDDISYDDLINGKVDCIKDINEIYIALAVCTKECKHIQLIVDGSTQVCPKCGEDMFRLKIKKYKIIKE